MLITVEFDSLAEFQAHMIFNGDGSWLINQKPDPAPAPEETKAEEPAPFEEMPAPDPAPEAPAKVDESFRVEVRKALSSLNKLQTGNPAKELIAQTGYKRLTDVPLDLLPGLMEKTQEAMKHV